MPAGGRHRRPPSGIRSADFALRRNRSLRAHGEKRRARAQKRRPRPRTARRSGAVAARDPPMAALPPPRRTTPADCGASFYDLVGAGQDRWWDRQPQRAGGLEIDNQLEGRRLLDRQIGRLGALEYPSDVNAGLAIGSLAACSIADQAANGGEFALRVDRWNGIA